MTKEQPDQDAPMTRYDQEGYDGAMVETREGEWVRYTDAKDALDAMEKERDAARRECLAWRGREVARDEMQRKETGESVAAFWTIADELTSARDANPLPTEQP